MTAPLQPDPLIAEYERQARRAAPSADPLIAEYEARRSLPDFSDVMGGATSGADPDPRLAGAIFGADDLVHSSEAAGFPLTTTATPPLDAADARKVRVALGAEQPRLSERIAPNDPVLVLNTGSGLKDTRAAMMAEKWLVEEGIPPVPRTPATEVGAVAAG